MFNESTVFDSQHVYILENLTAGTQRWRFGSDHFPLYVIFNCVMFRFLSPLLFHGVFCKNITNFEKGSPYVGS